MFSNDYRNMFLYCGIYIIIATSWWTVWWTVWTWSTPLCLRGFIHSICFPL